MNFFLNYQLMNQQQQQQNQVFVLNSSKLSRTEIRSFYSDKLKLNEPIIKNDKTFKRK